MKELLTFEQALKDSDSYKKRHLLLGNGFSIACRPDIFRYDRLHERVDWANIPDAAKKAFEALGTTDFERVIKALRDAAGLAKLYGLNRQRVQAMHDDSGALKELLVRTIAESHPERPSDITDDEYATCHAFLKHFHTIYTMNYDLLLYWTWMHQNDASRIQWDDGFRTSQDDIESGIDSEYVVWEPGQSHKQNVWFLHGALHVFDSGTEIRKYTWKRTGVRLIEQVREALDKGFFPLFVAEGTSEEKLERIRHSDYLAKAMRSFQAITGCLFIFGHSLAPNDDHFLRLIERGKITHLFVGIYGDPKDKENRAIVRRATRIADSRPAKYPLEVKFYDSATVHVWR